MCYINKFALPCLAETITSFSQQPSLNVWEVRRPVVDVLGVECHPILVWCRVFAAQQSCWSLYFISTKCFLLLKGLDCREASLALGLSSCKAKMCDGYMWFSSCWAMQVLPWKRYMVGSICFLKTYGAMKKYLPPSWFHFFFLLCYTLLHFVKLPKPTWPYVKK